jgi:predicted esterase
MTGDELVRPLSGSVGGVPYLALPPTAVDAEHTGGLIVCWHGFDAPRNHAAMAAALPMTGVPVWRVFLGLRLPDVSERDYLELLGSVAVRATAELPGAVADLRTQLGLPDGPIGLIGHGEGGTLALLAMAQRRIPIAAAALVAPIAIPARAVQARERRYGPYPWSAETKEIADRLDMIARAAEIAVGDPAILLVGGGTDLLVPPGDLSALRDELAEAGATVEAVSFRMGHALAAEPGTEPRPQIAAAVSVDAALTDWFRIPRSAKSARKPVSATWSSPD